MKIGSVGVAHYLHSTSIYFNTCRVKSFYRVFSKNEIVLIKPVSSHVKQVMVFYILLQVLALAS